MSGAGTLSGRTALVTGAGRGIGAAAARALATAGAHVYLTGRSRAPLQDLSDAIAKTGGHVSIGICDVADAASVKSALEAAQTATGRLDILVNNAGRMDPIARLENSDPNAWGEIIDINLKGVYHGLRYALPIMQAQGEGTIINISSGAATSALEGWSHYCASKAAVLSLTRCAHKEVGDQGVHVVGLSPGTVATRMQEEIRASGINPVSQISWDQHIPPEWVGQAIVHLATGGAKAHAGTDFSLKTDEGRREVGLPV